MPTDIQDSLAEYLNIMPVVEILKSEGIIYLLITMAMLFFAKFAYSFFSSFNLSEQLTKHDNKAVALSFAGYLFGVGIILAGILGTPSEQSGHINALLHDILATVFWGVLGILLLLIARAFNDRLIFSQFKNAKELVDDRNLGTGAIEFGSFVGSAIIIYSSQTGDADGLLISIAGCLAFFLVGQLGFWGYSALYQKIARFDVHGEIEKDNAAAGISFGLNLIAIAWMLGGFIRHSDSMLGCLLWALFSAVLLLSCRYLVDKLILPGNLLDEEIKNDRNWGASLVEGSAAIVIALVSTATFF